MKRTGHAQTGFWFGLTVVILAYRYLSVPILYCLVGWWALCKGSNAPDSLEFSSYNPETGFRQSLIPHRTYTHWLLGWAMLWLFFTLYFITIENFISWVGMMFCSGGLLHLLMDLPNKSGIPIIHPKKHRKSLKWWNSGEYEWQIISCFILLFGVVYYFVFLQTFLQHPSIQYAHEIINQLVLELKTDFIKALNEIRKIIEKL